MQWIKSIIIREGPIIKLGLIGYQWFTWLIIGIKTIIRLSEEIRGFTIRLTLINRSIELREGWNGNWIGEIHSIR